MGTLAVLSPAVQKVEAITIHRNLIDEGERFSSILRDDLYTYSNPLGTSEPSTAVGGGSLSDIFDVAADWWEKAILDPFEIILNFGWGDMPIDNRKNAILDLAAIELASELKNGRIIESNIIFNRNLRDEKNQPSKWFLDQTPHLNEEYKGFSEKRRDLGGGLVNVERIFTEPRINSPAIHFDLLTVAKHEIGHALGLDATGRKKSDLIGPIIIGNDLPFSGTKLNFDGVHFPVRNKDGSIDNNNVLVNTLMNDASRFRERRLQSEVDILAVAQASGFTQVNLDPHKVPEPISILGLLTLGTLGAFSIMKCKRKQLSRHC
ncbi:MAG: PEP-CTERM sorting domain-containing protein [Moorea sp. SIO2I5]|nr:PEP-CTERM sorting domain-containing protein [Moorena sp. SIO2I5]